MGIAYMVVARDGNEYGPIDRDTIQQWYNEGRLDQNSKVYEPGQHKFRLKEVFDLTVWDDPRLVDEAAAKAKGHPEFQPKTNIIAVPRERTPGMVVVASLLLVIGLVELLVVAVALVQDEHTPKGQIFEYALAGLADLVLAVGLFLGNQKFRGWGLGRSVLGACLILLGLLTSAAPPLQWGYSGFELLLCAGIALLLAGESPSRLRIGAGGGAVLAAWSGLITLNFVEGYTDAGVEAQTHSIFEIAGDRGTRSGRSSSLTGYVQPVTAFEDDSLGINLRVPNGWVLLTSDNPIVQRPDAVCLAANEQAGCFASLEMVAAQTPGTSSDELVARIMMRIVQTEPSVRMTRRTDVMLGGNGGVRVETSRMVEGSRIRGFTSACKAGGSYYFLSGWSIGDDYDYALEEFEHLEQAFRIRGTAPVPPAAGALPEARPVRSPESSRNQ